jgi:hypothetical protein
MKSAVKTGCQLCLMFLLILYYYVGLFIVLGYRTLKERLLKHR